MLGLDKLLSVLLRAQCRAVKNDLRSFGGRRERYCVYRCSATKGQLEEEVV